MSEVITLRSEKQTSGSIYAHRIDPKDIKHKCAASAMVLVGNDASQKMLDTTKHFSPINKIIITAFTSKEPLVESLANITLQIYLQFTPHSHPLLSVGPLARRWLPCPLIVFRSGDTTGSHRQRCGSFHLLEESLTTTQPNMVREFKMARLSWGSSAWQSAQVCQLW